MISENSDKNLLKKIRDMINLSMSTGQDFNSLLEERGLSYEDIRYEKNPDIQAVKGKYKGLDAYAKRYHGVPVVSFFSGAGGLDLGFESAGYEHLCLVENNEVFCNTIRKNRDWEVVGPPYASGDISQRQRISAQLEKLGVNKNFEGIFIGGPPCQPFSIAANQRFSKEGSNFKRVGFDSETNGNLLFDYAWFIKKYAPKAFLIENVPGIVDLDGGKQLSSVCKSLEKKGYTIYPPLIINAASFGVPQQRQRIFIVGHRGQGKFNPPAPHSAPIACADALWNIDVGCPNHVTRKHKAGSIARYMKLDVGKRDTLGRVDRLDPRLPSKTVIAGGSAGGGRSHLHPYIPRTISVRECARLQTFPDDYIFTGSHARQFTQVGNAVPPVLGSQLAYAIYGSFFG